MLPLFSQHPERKVLEEMSVYRYYSFIILVYPKAVIIQDMSIFNTITLCFIFICTRLMSRVPENAFKFKFKMIRVLSLPNMILKIFQTISKKSIWVYALM